MKQLNSVQGQMAELEQDALALAAGSSEEQVAGGGFYSPPFGHMSFAFWFLQSINRAGAHDTAWGS